jgi:hypothetical protein
MQDAQGCCPHLANAHIRDSFNKIPAMNSMTIGNENVVLMGITKPT